MVVVVVIVGGGDAMDGMQGAMLDSEDLKERYIRENVKINRRIRCKFYNAVDAFKVRYFLYLIINNIKNKKHF